MPKLDSLQRQIIREIKYEVKKDLMYVSSHKMFLKASRYGTNFRNHTLEWLQAKFSQYKRHIYPKDKEIITREIKSWIQKLESQCTFY